MEWARKQARSGQNLTRNGTPKADKPRKRPGKLELRTALISGGGVVRAIADGYDVSRQTIYDWIEFYDLGDVLIRARTAMFDIAVDNILGAVDKGDLDMSRFVVTHMPTTERSRWSNRQELTGANGVPLNATPELITLMERLNISGDDLVRELETMLRNEVGSAPELPAKTTPAKKARKVKA
jgi:hypothetical protein